jgi:hypothetical protein
MRDLVIRLIHMITTILRFVRSRGVRTVVAESVLAKHQLLILNRSRQCATKSPRPAPGRLIARIGSLWNKPNRLRRVAIAFKLSTLLNSHRALVKRKYRPLFSPKQRTKPGCMAVIPTTRQLRSPPRPEKSN